MKHKEKLQQLAAAMNGVSTNHDLQLQTEIIEGDVDVLIVTVEDREEFPIYVTVDDSQILCISYLWLEEEVREGKRSELLDVMLTMNVPMPLSSFSKLGNQYLIFGALSNRATLEDILEEIDVLSDNTLTAIEELSDYLNK